MTKETTTELTGLARVKAAFEKQAARKVKAGKSPFAGKLIRGIHTRIPI
jgi:hypothetical protein